MLPWFVLSHPFFVTSVCVFAILLHAYCVIKIDLKHIFIDHISQRKIFNVTGTKEIEFIFV